jgi:hypothetical protein
LATRRLPMRDDAPDEIPHRLPRPRWICSFFARRVVRGVRWPACEQVSASLPSHAGCGLWVLRPRSTL